MSRYSSITPANAALMELIGYQREVRPKFLGITGREIHPVPKLHVQQFLPDLK
jgi:hypothetical protein